MSDPDHSIHDEIMPGPARTESERARWRAMPTAVRVERFDDAIAAGFAHPAPYGLAGTYARNAPPRYWLSPMARNDMKLIEQRQPEHDPEAFHALFQMLVQTPEIGRVPYREDRNYRRYKTEAHHIYYRQHGRGIVIGRVLDQYWMRLRPEPRPPWCKGAPTRLSTLCRGL